MSGSEKRAEHQEPQNTWSGTYLNLQGKLCILQMVGQEKQSCPSPLDPNIVDEFQMLDTELHF